GPSDRALVARGTYVQYLETALRESAARAPRGVSFGCRHADVTGASLREEGLRLTLAPEAHLDAQMAVIALGNFPTVDLAVEDGGVYSSDRYARSPFVAGALDGIERDAPVVFLGSG